MPCSTVNPGSAASSTSALLTAVLEADDGRARTAVAGDLARRRRGAGALDAQGDDVAARQRRRIGREIDLVGPRLDPAALAVGDGQAVGGDLVGDRLPADEGTGRPASCQAAPI